LVLLRCIITKRNRIKSRNFIDSCHIDKDKERNTICLLFYLEKVWWNLKTSKNKILEKIFNFSFFETIDLLKILVYICFLIDEKICSRQILDVIYRTKYTTFISYRISERKLKEQSINYKMKSSIQIDYVERKRNEKIFFLL